MILLKKPFHFSIYMFSKKTNILFLFCALYLSAPFFVHAQKTPGFFKDAIAEKRTAFYNKVVAGINIGFALPFTIENEESYNNAFYNIGLIQYKTPKIDTAKIGRAHV